MLLRHKFPYYCQACHFSPFDAHLLAVGTSQNFGFVGSGELLILQIPPVEGALPKIASNRAPPFASPQNIGSKDFYPGAQIVERVLCPTSNSILDCSWSESSDSVIVTAMGDSTILVFDLKNELSNGEITPMIPKASPANVMRGHTQEVASVDWNIYQRHLIVSASWDASLRLWDVPRNMCISSLETRSGPLFAAAFSPLESSLVATVGGDKKLSVYDLRRSQRSNLLESTHANAAGPQPANPTLGSGAPNFTYIQSCVAHTHDAMCLDWSKYNPYQIVTGGADGVIRVWDIRRLESQPGLGGAPVVHIPAHKLAVRRVKYSPFHRSVLASASLDMSVSIWNTEPSGAPKVMTNYRNTPNTQPVALVGSYTHHSEFVLGLDWSLFKENLICAASWDRTVSIWNSVNPVLS